MCVILLFVVYEAMDIPSSLRSNQLSLDNRFKVTNDNITEGEGDDDIELLDVDQSG